jgi:hypothetical protein
LKKHALMLTAATIALLAGQASATTTITEKKTSALKTSTINSGAADDIEIGTGGSVVVTISNPAIKIDSDNSVTIDSGTTVSNKGTDGAIGIQLNATTAGTGPGDGTPGSATALDSLGTIDLTGSGTDKTAVLVKAIDGAGSIFNGDITLEASSNTRVTGDGSTGLDVAADTTLNGNITILGALLATASSTTATTTSNITAIMISGDVNGDFEIDSGAAAQGVGQAADGLVLTGALHGSLTISGVLEAVGTTSPSSGGSNPEGGHALIISSDVDGGIYFDGPSSTSTSTTAASIGIRGIGPAIYISPGAVATSPGAAFTIGTYTDPQGSAIGFSILNRGAITAQSHDPNFTESALYLSGGSSAPVTLMGGIFNSGAITAAAVSDSNRAASDNNPNAPRNATAVFIGNYVTVGLGTNPAYALVNTTDSSTTSGIISASVDGTNGGTATAISIGSSGTSLPSLFNDGTISASATTTDTSITNLSAYAINDGSGTLATIVNSGTISATATTLDSDTQRTVAANLSSNTSGVMFMNTGAVSGDIVFGSGNDLLSINGPTGGSSSISGDIAFGGTTSGFDMLNIGTAGGAGLSYLTGAVTETGGGRINVDVGGSGRFTLTNTGSALVANTLLVEDGGVLNVSVSNAFNQQADATAPALVVAHTIDFQQLSTLNLSFGSFVSTPGGSTAMFTLFDADTSLTMGDPAAIKASIKSSIPYLFKGTLCGYNITGGFSNSSGCSSSTGNSQLVLSLAPKTAGQIGLKGNAAKIFNYANDALATDDVLGGAVVTYVTDKASAQAAYSSFVPDLSGSTRAVAISITDQATGPVGARQRALRMYASQPGGATLWGQEFVQRLNSATNSDAFRASGFGFALGFDSGNPRSGRYGGAFTFFSGDQTSKGPNLTKTTNEFYMLTGYTDWRGKGLFLDSQLSVGFANLNGRRRLALEDGSGNTVLVRRAASKRSGLLLAGGVSTGVVLTYGGTVITPQISLDGLTMREEGYTETGGGGATAGADGFDLKVHPYYANSVRGYFGTTLRQDINLGDFFVQPEARVGYRYDFLADPVKLRAAFVSLAGTSGSAFTLTGPDPERGTAVFGGSLAVTTGAWSLGLNYDYLRGNSGAVSQAGTLTLVGRI